MESYGDETSNTAVNLASQQNNNNNNNNTIKIDSAHSSPHERNEEHLITSVTNPWERKHRLSIPMNCGPPPQPPQLTSVTNVARATPTSSDQISNYDDHNKDRGHSTDIDEEVIVDNTDDEDCPKKSRICDKQDDKNR